MLSTEEQINVLVHLSMADKHLAEEESKVIHNIGERNGMTKEQVDQIINNPKPISSLRHLPPDEKFDYLYNVIFLMKVDGKIFQSEIPSQESLLPLLASFGKELIVETGMIEFPLMSVHVGQQQTQLVLVLWW